MLLATLLTPFDANGKVDLGKLRAHVLWLAAAGIEGFVATSIAGEFLYLTARERQAIHQTVLDAARFHTVIPFVWDPNPRTCVSLAEAAREGGAKAVLIPPPLIYDLDQSAIISWYTGLSQHVRVPIYAVHSPRLTPSVISDETYQTLRAAGVLAGLEDASEDPFRVRRLAAKDPGAILASGDRLLIQSGSMEGLGGVVSTLANAWPSLALRIHQGEIQLADALMNRTHEVKRAGGLRALKGVLGMGCRWPLPAVEPQALRALPAKDALR